MPSARSITTFRGIQKQSRASPKPRTRRPSWGLSTIPAYLARHVLFASSRGSCGVRKYPRYIINQSAQWDFYSTPTGKRSGFIEDISEKGCLLRTTDPIDHRRWVRVTLKERNGNLCFTAVGRAVRYEERLEPCGPYEVTLFRQGIEFTQPLNPLLIWRMTQDRPTCVMCGCEDAAIPDMTDFSKFYCLSCHARKSQLGEKEEALTSPSLLLPSQSGT